MKPQEDCQDAAACRLVKLRQSDPNSKLGFSLRGGKEATGSSVGVFVSHIEPLSQASKIGLRVGDQLIQVNGLPVSQLTHDEVIELIKRTPRCDHICLLVNYVGRVPFQEKVGEPIGWLRVDEEDGGGAGSDPQSNQTSHCGEALMNLSDEQQLAENGSYGNGRDDDKKSIGEQPPTLLMTRTTYLRDSDSAASSKSLTFTTASSTSSCVSSTKDDEEEEEDPTATQTDHRHLQLAGQCRNSSASSAVSTSSGCSISMSSVQSGHSSMGGRSPPSSGVQPLMFSHDDEPAETPVRVPGGMRTNEPFGCGVVKGPDEWPGIFVQNVKRDSLAERVGLEPGDQLIRAEHYELSELSFDEAISVIKNLQQQQDELLLVVRKGAALRHLAKCKQNQSGLASTVSPQSTTTTNNDDGDDDNLRPNEKCQTKCQPPPARRKPVEPPPAPPTRRTQQTKPASDEGGPAAAAVAANGGRLHNSISSATDEATAMKANQPTPMAVRRQKTVQQLNALEQSDFSSSATQSKTICERISGMPPTDRATPERQPPARRLARAAVEVLATSRQAPHQMESPERVAPAGDSPEALSASFVRSTMASRAAEERPQQHQRRQQREQAHQHQQQTQKQRAMTHSNLVQPLPSATDYEQLTWRNDVANIGEGGEDVTSECCWRVPPRSSGHADMRDGKSGSPLESNNEASLHCRQPGTATNVATALEIPTRAHTAERTRQVGADLTTKRESIGTFAASKRSAQVRTMSRYVSNDERDQDQDQEDASCEQEEQIRIVKQNCKLHHNSVPSLVRSKMFLQHQQQLAQQNALVNDCHHLHLQASSDRSTNATPRDLIASPQKCRPFNVTKTHHRPPPAPLQRYVSVDNLYLHNVQQVGGNQRAVNAGRLKRLSQQMMLDAELASQRSAGLNGGAFRLMNRASRLGAHSRSNSALNQSPPSLACCPVTNHELMQALGDEQLHQQMQRRQLHLSQVALNGPSQADLMDCCLEMTQLNRQCRMPMSTAGLVRPTTMKHLRAASNAVAAVAKMSNGGSPSKLFAGQQPCSNTLALARFKARSEDKLNLMNINLNYVKINNSANQKEQQQQQIASKHLLRLQQARHQQQARLLAANSTSKRHHDWRRLVDATELVPGCCTQQRQQQSQQQQCQKLTPASVFNYATATGIISQARKVSPMARSCCSINRAPSTTRCEQHDNTGELFDLMMRKQKQQQHRTSKVATAKGNSCYAYGCNYPTNVSQQDDHLMIARVGTPSQLMRHPMPNGKHLVSFDAPSANGGATTDSSGYQSASEAARQRLAASSNVNQMQHKKQPTTSVNNCCQFGAAQCNEESAKRDVSQTKRMSTFSPKPVTSPRQSRPTCNAPSAIEISTSGGSCVVSSLGSTTASSASSLSPSTCSPLSSPGHRYLSSASSASSAADLPPSPPTFKQSNHDAEPAPGGKSRLFKRRTGNTGEACKTGQDKTKGKSIPRPPPMPLDDRTLSSDSATLVATKTRQQQQQQAQRMTSESEAGTLAQANKLIGSKLCFVDELKMIAGQTQRLPEAATHGQLGDSSTMIKLINAKKAATSSAPRPGSDARGGGGQCNCCESGECSLAGNITDCKRSDSSCSQFGCAKRPAKISREHPPKGVQLRNEEDNKRRQHELLMEEFKTAHFKMFNRLRRASNENPHNTSSDNQNGQDFEDNGERANEDRGDGNDPNTKLSKISKGNTGLANLRPRPTVATN